MPNKSNFTPQQLKELEDYFRQRFGLYEIISGGNSVGHGRVEFGLTTETQQGLHIYETGNCKMSSNLSMEIRSGHEGDAEHGKIWIHAVNGDIHIEAPNGDLVLSGKNVLINATDAKGYVSMNSPRNVEINSASASINADNIQATAALTASVLGSYTTIHGENSNDILKGYDEIVDGSLIQKIIGAIEEIKKFFKSTCG